MAGRQRAVACCAWWSGEEERRRTVAGACLMASAARDGAGDGYLVAGGPPGAWGGDAPEALLFRDGERATLPLLREAGVERRGRRARRWCPAACARSPSPASRSGRPPPAGSCAPRGSSPPGVTCRSADRGRPPLAHWAFVPLPRPRRPETLIAASRRRDRRGRRPGGAGRPGAHGSRRPRARRGVDRRHPRGRAHRRAGRAGGRRPGRAARRARSRSSWPASPASRCGCPWPSWRRPRGRRLAVQAAVRPAVGDRPPAQRDRRPRAHPRPAAALPARPERPRRPGGRHRGARRPPRGPRQGRCSLKQARDRGGGRRARGRPGRAAPAPGAAAAPGRGAGRRSCRRP